MGRTIVPLTDRPLKTKPVFDKRFVVEAVEDYHIHYRNLRLALNKEDFMSICQGCMQAFERWNTRGCPENPSTHIELCRKSLTGLNNDNIKINLNDNLYNRNAGKIFAEGAEFTEPEYIHLKIRDIRLEMSIDEFKELENAIKEASGRLKSCRPSPVL